MSRKPKRRPGARFTGSSARPIAASTAGRSAKRRFRATAATARKASRPTATTTKPPGTAPDSALLLLVPEVQHRRGRGAADHAGQTELDLPGGGGSNAAERQRALADLPPSR